MPYDGDILDYEKQLKDKNLPIDPPNDAVHTTQYQACVITPTTSSPELVDAIKSVAEQTVPTKHMIVVDGELYSPPDDLLEEIFKYQNVRLVQLSDNTGGDGQGFYGHRVLAGFSYLVNEPYILFLDQDNWYKPEHVETLIATIKENQLDWAFSLRDIHAKDKSFIAPDNCESLGIVPVWNSLPDQPHYHVDTSTYCFKRDFLVKVAGVWYQGYGGDRIFFNTLRTHVRPMRYGTSCKHTLCYRLDGNPNSLNKEFILKGNEVMKEVHGDKFPWHGE